VFCTNCGGALPDSSAFCPSCGRPTGAGAGAGAFGQGPPPYAPYVASPPYTAPPRPRFADPITGRPLAEWWRRLLAYLLDALIVSVPSYFIYEIALVHSFSTIKFPSACSQQNVPNNCGVELFHSFFSTFLVTFLAYFAAQLVVGTLYYTLLVGAPRGQTVGMMALSIAVRDERDDVSIGRWRAFTRWFVFFVLAIPFGIPALIDCLAPLWDKRRQSWHDHAARSVVIDVD
jgi:uncharacterized RDD family membrane protein YckC